MTPIEFPGANMVIGKDQPEYLPLPALLQDDAPYYSVTSCWHLTWKERFKLLLSGRVYVTQLTFGKMLQPQRVSLEHPTPEAAA